MSDPPLVCANHPNRPTTLRCNHCEKPICSRCAVLTPVGYRCKECVKGQQNVFETAQRRDYLIVFLVAGLGVGLSMFVVRLLGYWMLLVGPLIGTGLADLTLRAVRGRRGRRLPLAAILGGVAGTLPHLVLPLGGLVLSLASGAGGNILAVLLGMLWPVAAAVLIIGAMYVRFRGIRL
jgi:hypothetical protein